MLLSHPEEDPTLTISFFKNPRFILSWLLIIQPEVFPCPKDFDEVSQQGEGRGLGLSKVADILNRYPKVSLETRSCDHHLHRSSFSG